MSDVYNEHLLHKVRNRCQCAHALGQRSACSGAALAGYLAVLRKKAAYQRQVTCSTTHGTCK